MSNRDALNNIFCEIFSVDANQLNESFSKKNVTGWDSVRQLGLATAIEDAFDIMLDAEDILELSSYLGTVNILKKYDIEV